MECADLSALCQLLIKTINVSQETIQGYRLSPQQKRLWQLHECDPKQPYLVRCLIEIEGELDESRLQGALNHVVKQHEILRSSFQLLPGMTIPVQVIADQAVVSLGKTDLSLLSPLEQTTSVGTLFDDKSFPLDYASLPLLRTELLRLSGNKNLLMLSAPALCMDEPSLYCLFQQIAVAYGVLKIDADPVAAESMQYADFAEWQNELLESAEHWKQSDATFDFEQRLPFERMRPSGSSASIELPDAVMQKLADVAGTYEASIPTLLLACWQTLLLRSTAWENITVAVAFDGRNFPELKNAVGPIERYLPISSHRQDDLKFSLLLRQLNEQQQEAARLQQYFAPDQLAQFAENERSPRFPFGFAWHEQPKELPMYR